ncbi:MAG: hypothetical protein H6Q05_1142 [Acidobacteria bacterium]|nr:hypothetical protein [Acidobacteriota bacterium]
MKTEIRILKIVCILAVLIAMTGLAQAQWLNNNEVAFTGAVTSVIANGEGVGTLFVRLDTLEQRVLVNSKTRLSEGTDEISMDRLAEMVKEGELFVEVVGKFSSSGVLATLVRVVGSLDEDTFRVRGTIGQIAVSGDNLLLTLLGMKILATPGTAILIDGLPGLSSDLRNGIKVEAEGNIDAASGTWTAETIRILTENKRRGSLVFEGEVKAFDSNTGRLDVAVTGVPGNVTTVYITPATRVVGELNTGAIVQVSGTLNPDLSVKAKEIMVLSALEIKPDDCKLKVGTAAQFTVKLREIAAADVTVTLVVDDEAVIALSTPTVTIPKDSQTANFNVQAMAVGTAIIKATDGTNTAIAEVKVGGLSDDETDPPDLEVRIAFAPDHIKLGLNESREVVLLIKPPQKAPVEVIFEITSDPPDVFAVGGQRTLSNGAASLKVLLKAGALAGSGTVTAVLPEDLGGGTAELIVEVGKGTGKK